MSGDLKLGKSQEAMACYERVLKVKPGHVKARYNLDAILQDQGKLGSEGLGIATVTAAPPLKANAEAQPPSGPVTGQASAAALTTEGVALAQKGQRQAAMELFRQALGQDPSYACAHHNLGVALSEEDRLDEAVTSFRKAIRLRPSP